MKYIKIVIKIYFHTIKTQEKRVKNCISQTFKCICLIHKKFEISFENYV